MNIVADSSVVGLPDGDLAPGFGANSSSGSFLVGSVNVDVAESGSLGSSGSHGSSFVGSPVVPLSALAGKARGMARVFGTRVMVGPVIEAASVVLDRVTRARSSSLALAPLLMDAPSTPPPVVSRKRKAPVVPRNLVAVSGSPLPLRKRKGSSSRSRIADVVDTSSSSSSGSGPVVFSSSSSSSSLAGPSPGLGPHDLSVTPPAVLLDTLVSPAASIRRKRLRCNPHVLEKKRQRRLVRTLERQLAEAKAVSAALSDDETVDSCQPPLARFLPTLSTAAPSDLSVVHNEALDSLRADVSRLQAILAAQPAAPWARNSSFKSSAIAPAPAQSSLEQQLSDGLSLKGPKSKSLQTGGICVEVLSLLSANVDSVTRRGMSVAYSMICSGVTAGSVTSGLQLTRSKFNLMVEHGWCPESVSYEYYEDASLLFTGHLLEERMSVVRTESEKDEPTPVSSFLGSVENVRLILDNIFSVIDVTYCLSPAAAEALYEGLVSVPVSWYTGHSFGHNEFSVVVMKALMKSVFSWARSFCRVGSCWS